MIKSWEDYYNDPEIVHEPSAMREIHAIRMMIHDEREKLGITEYNAGMVARINAYLAEFKRHRGLT